MMNHSLLHTGRLIRLSVTVAFFLAAVPLLHGQESTEPDKVNLGAAINTEYDEIYPLISPDGKVLYFVRKNDPRNMPDSTLGVDPEDMHKDDIWFSERHPDGSWGMAVNIGPPLNNWSFNYVCGVLPDNNTLLLGNSYYKSGKMGQGVSMSRRTENGWSFPENLEFREFSNENDYAEYTISPHTNVLILSIRPTEFYHSKSRGMRDLYVSFRLDDGTWSAPESIGDEVNTVYNEITPYLASDGKTLYFSSNRPGGLGKNDVYITRRLDDTWKSWSPPRNMGHPINTPSWDAFFSVPGNEPWAYVVSTTERGPDADSPGFGRSDIFRVKLSQSIRPTPIMIVSGKVLDAGGNVIPTKIVYERLSDNTVMGTAAVNPATGEYKIALPAGELYGFHPESQGFYADNEHIDLRNLESYEEIHRDITLLPAATGTTITLNNIFFEFDEASLRPESDSELQRLASFMKNNPAIRIEIAGHTDDVGTDSYNQKLSFERASAVAAYLYNAGIGHSRVVARGYGESKPIAPNDSDEGRQKNRRVEFTIL